MDYTVHIVLLTKHTNKDLINEYKTRDLIFYPKCRLFSSLNPSPIVVNYP